MVTYLGIGMAAGLLMAIAADLAWTSQYNLLLIL